MCSTIVFGRNSQKYLAENYDHSLDHGLVVVNLKDTIKENGRQAGERAIRWQVKYGSITLNQFSLELPVSGMNEKGLAVALLWHEGGDFGTDESYSRLSALQWIQYQLDNHQNISEVLEGLETIRPKQEIMALHYMVLDAEGNSLLVEFIGGEPQLQLNPEYPILTNSSYLLCLENSQNRVSSQFHPENSSIARFNRLYKNYLEHNRGNATASLGFDWLQSVSQNPKKEQSFPWDNGSGNHTITVWSAVFSPTEKIIRLKTHRNESVREIKFTDHDFEKESQYMIMDINEGITGSAAPFFKPYSAEHNRDIIRRTAQAFPLPKSEQDNLVNLVDRLYKNREISLG